MTTRIAVCCAVLFCATALCTAEDKPTFSVGLRGGISSAGVRGRDAVLTKQWFSEFPKLYRLPVAHKDMEPLSKPVFSGGLYAQYALAGGFSVQCEVLLKPEALLYEREMLIGYADWQTYPIRLHLDSWCTYLDIPFLLKKVFPLTGDMDPYLYAGPRMSILLKQEDKGRLLEVTPDDEGYAVSADFDVRPLVWGACIGGGLYTHIKNKVRFALDIRYDWSIQSAVTSMTLANTRSRELDVRFCSLGISGIVEFVL